MPLLEGDHALLVEVALPVCERYGLAITGGYAMKAHGLVDRPSDDIDFATRSMAPIEEITEALAAAYRAADCQARVIRTGGRFGHLDVALPRAWAIEWSARLSMEMAETEPWSADEDWTDDD